jgi:hypothetical protein
VGQIRKLGQFGRVDIGVVHGVIVIQTTEGLEWPMKKAPLPGLL